MEEKESSKFSPTVDVVHISIEDSSTCVEPDADTVARMVKEHREMMHQVAEIQGNSPKSLVMSLAKYESIIHHLQHPEVKVEPHFKYWVKSRQFQLLDLPDEAETQVLVIPKYKMRKWGFKPSFLRVVHAGHLSDLVYRVHAEELQHSGYKRVLEKVQKQYFGVTRVFVQEFCKTCPVCKLKPHQSAPVAMPGQPTEPRIQTRVERYGFFQDTAHIDLIDMRQTPDGEYRFIGHFMDEYSRFHILFPMKRKAAPELARLLEERVLGYFGPPKVFHASEGTEIVNRLVSATFDKWGGDVTFIDKHSRNSRSGRVMERYRRVILERLADIQEYEGDWKGDRDRKGANKSTTRYPWANWLPRVMFTLNSECQDSAKDSPYFSVYGCSSPVLLYTEERCQGREKPPVDYEEEGEDMGEGFHGAGWGSEAGGGDREEECATGGVSRPVKTLHKQERDHNYITTSVPTSTTFTKRFKTEVPDYDEED